MKFLFECRRIFLNTKNKLGISVSPSGHVKLLCSTCYINTNEITNHSAFDNYITTAMGIFFTHEDNEDNMLLLCVKISCFHTTAHLVIHWF